MCKPAPRRPNRTLRARPAKCHEYWWLVIFAVSFICMFSALNIYRLEGVVHELSQQVKHLNENNHVLSQQVKELNEENRGLSQQFVYRSCVYIGTYSICLLGILLGNWMINER